MLVFAGFLFWNNGGAQTTTAALQKAYAQFAQDPQLKHASSSLYVIDAKTGKVVFEKNAQLGLAPASTQKIITSVTAFELLGKDFVFKTALYLNGRIVKDSLKGDLIIRGIGDPTFGSWRYATTRREMILQAIQRSLKKRNIRVIDGAVIIDERGFETNATPDGWIWQDVGNYYGAGAFGFNWNENQFDLKMRSGAEEHTPVTLVDAVPGPPLISISSEVTVGPKGSGDNAYIYFPAYSDKGIVRGTIPPSQSGFVISGALSHPAEQFNREIAAVLSAAGITVTRGYSTSQEMTIKGAELNYKNNPFDFLASPPLDSIIYWLNKKSINLYAECLLKSFARERNGLGRTDSGAAITRRFWKERGIDEDELNIYDGSGLSPLNRVTTHAQVKILQFARTRDWFKSFFDALPEYNGMHMKSGTISDVKGFCGYHTASDGRQYIFSFLVNNYSGTSSSLVNKMYKVLDKLKS